MKIELEILNTTTVHSLPGIWTGHELRNLLLKLDMPETEGLGEADLLEMTLMALQDIGHQKAGEAVLESVFGASISAGVRQNLVDDLQDEEPWQDFSNVKQQGGIFVAVVLSQAFPNRYPNPDALKLELAVRGADPAGLDNVVLIRLLSTAMAPTDVLRRLYSTELSQGYFEDADGMVWHRQQQDDENLSIISSRQWLGPLKKGMQVSGRLPGR